MSAQHKVEGGVVDAHKNSSGHLVYHAKSKHEGKECDGFYTLGAAVFWLWCIDTRVEGARQRKGMRVT